MDLCAIMYQERSGIASTITQVAARILDSLVFFQIGPRLLTLGGKLILTRWMIWKETLTICSICNLDFVTLWSKTFFSNRRWGFYRPCRQYAQVDSAMPEPHHRCLTDRRIHARNGNNFDAECCKYGPAIFFAGRRAFSWTGRERGPSCVAWWSLGRCAPSGLWASMLFLHNKTKFSN